MSAETLSLLAGAVLSLLFSYVPGLAGWYGRLGTDPGDGGTLKRLVMLALLALVAGGAFALACAGLGESLGIAVSCDQAGAVGLLRALVLAVVANQSTYKITKRGGGPAAPLTAGS